MGPTPKFQPSQKHEKLISCKPKSPAGGGGGLVPEVVALDSVFVVSAIFFSSSSPKPALRTLTVFVLARY